MMHAAPGSITFPLPNFFIVSIFLLHFYKVSSEFILDGLMGQWKIYWEFLPLDFSNKRYVQLITCPSNNNVIFLYHGNLCIFISYYFRIKSFYTYYKTLFFNPWNFRNCFILNSMRNISLFLKVCLTGNPGYILNAWPLCLSPLLLASETSATIPSFFFPFLVFDYRCFGFLLYH